MHTHIGKLIRARLEAVGMTKAEFARRIHTSRQNVNLILSRASVHTDLLYRISEVLDYDFFADLRPPGLRDLEIGPERETEGEPEARGVYPLLRLDGAMLEMLLAAFWRRFGKRA